MSKKKKCREELAQPLISLYWHKVIPFTQSSFVKKKTFLVLRRKKKQTNFKRLTDVVHVTYGERKIRI